MSASDPTPPAPPRRRVPLWAFVVAGLVVLALAGITLVTLSTVALVRHETAGPDQRRPASRAAIGEPARDGKFEFTVHEVQCGQDTVGAGIFTKEATGQFCVATVTVKNVGRSPQSFSDGAQRAFAPDGKEYGPDSEAAEYLTESPSGMDINPGNAIETAVVFDIPANASISQLRLHDQQTSRGAEIAVPR